MGVSIKSLKGKVKRPVRVAKVCLDGSLWAKYDELSEQLDLLRAQNTGQTMAEGTKLKAAAQKLADVEEQMRKAQVSIEFQGISAFQLKLIQKRFPLEGSAQQLDIDAALPALMAASAVEPTTEEEAEEFLAEIHKAAADRVFEAVWAATGGSSEVPFSERASELIHSSGSK